MQQKIVIIGAGFAGMWSALGARRLIDLHGGDERDIKVIVVAPKPELVVRPRLYESNPGSMAAPLGDVFRATGVEFVQGTVDKIRTAERQLDVVDSAGVVSTISYDRLVLAAGSRLVQPKIPGLGEYSFNIDQIENAVRLERHLQGLVYRPATSARNTVVVCGGGFTGIELAAELPHRLRSIFGDDASVRVVVVDRSPELGPELGPGPRPVILRALSELGVELRLGTAVAAVDEHGVVTADGRRIDATTVVWTAGMEATALTKHIPGDKDRLGRLHVDQDLRVPLTRDVFATGDAAFAATDDKGHNAMMSCQHALTLGRAAGYNAAADLLKIDNRPYSQPNYGTCLDLGPWGSLVSSGWDREVKAEGAHAKMLKKYINGTLIYPPKADKAQAFALADPDILVPDLPTALGQLASVALGAKV